MNCEGAASRRPTISTIQNTPDMSLSGVWPSLDPSVALLLQLRLSGLLRSDSSVQANVSSLGDNFRLGAFGFWFITVVREIICASACARGIVIVRSVVQNAALRIWT